MVSEMLCMHYIKKDWFGLVRNWSLISISMVRTETASWPTSAGPRPQSSPKCDQSGPVLGLSSVLGLDLKTLLAVHGLMIIKDPTHLTKGVVICGEALCLTKSKYLLISIGLPVPCRDVSQSVDLGQNNNPNTTPTKDYEKVRVVVYLRGVQRGCAEEGERGSTPTG